MKFNCNDDEDSKHAELLLLLAKVAHLAGDEDRRLKNKNKRVGTRLDGIEWLLILSCQNALQCDPFPPLSGGARRRRSRTVRRSPHTARTIPPPPPETIYDIRYFLKESGPALR